MFWKHLDRVPVPFGELAWDHARRHLVAEGRAATEQEIADAVAALLRRAQRGPADTQAPAPSKRDARVAAATRASSPATPAAERPDEPGDSCDESVGGEPAQPPRPDECDTPLAKVIPLGVFDPFAEADKRW